MKEKISTKKIIHYVGVGVISIVAVFLFADFITDEILYMITGVRF